jgi:predicted RNA binding protein YcfA (HicA-like mRNA interferase family)
MSRQLPALKPKDVIRALERAGFVVRRIRGSHHQLTHPNNPVLRTTVPHGTKDIKRGLLRAILKDCEITPDEFLDFL